jgi:hypothetical protein
MQIADKIRGPGATRAGLKRRPIELALSRDAVARLLPELPVALCSLVLLLLPITWFRGGSYVDTGDMSWPLDWGRYLHAASYAWEQSGSLGNPHARQVTDWPAAAAGTLFQTLGLSGPALEQMLFGLWLALPLVTMYVLARVLGLSRRAALGAGLFYALNPFVLEVVWNLSNGEFMPFYGLLPLHIALFILCYRGGSSWTFAWLVNGLLFLTIPLTVNLSLSNPGFTLMLWLVSAAWLGYDLLIRRVTLRALIPAAQFGVCWLLLNSFWIVPILSNAGSEFAQAGLLQLTDAQIWRLNSVQVIDALRLTGIWYLQSGFGGDAYYPWSATLTASWFVALSFLVPILFVIGVLRAAGRDRHVPLYCLLFLIGVYSSALSYVPGGTQVLALLHAHAPAFERTYRGAFLKFGLLSAFGAAPLIGLALAGMIEAARRAIGRLGSLALGIAFCLPLFGLLVFPFWTGGIVFPGGQNALVGAQLQLPAVYSQRLPAETARVPHEARLLSLPQPATYNLSYSWGRDSQGRLQGYYGADFVYWLSSMPAVVRPDEDTSGVAATIGTGLGSLRSRASLDRLLGLLSVRLLILHQDMTPALEPTTTITHPLMLASVRRLLRGQVQDFGRYSLYRVPTSDVMPMVYAPRDLVDSGPTPQALLTAVRSAGAAYPMAAFAPLSTYGSSLSSGQAQRSHRRRGGVKVAPIAAPASLSFRRVNPTEYDVTIRGARAKPFLLVLGQEFDPGWQAYVIPSQGGNGGAVSCTPRAFGPFRASVHECPAGDTWLSAQQVSDMRRQALPAAQHLEVNGFANAWLVTPSDTRNGRSFTIVLDYAPQHRVLIGFGMTLLSLVIVLLLAAFRIAGPWLPRWSWRDAALSALRRLPVERLPSRRWR